MKVVMIDYSYFLMNGVNATWKYKVQGIIPPDIDKIISVLRERADYIQSVSYYDTILKVVARDSKHLLRKDIYPEYKGDRKKKSPEMEDLLSIVGEIDFFPSFIDVMEDGAEADDVIYSYVKEYSEMDPSTEFQLWSKDSDMLSLYCITPNIVFKWFGGWERTLEKNIPEKYEGIAVKDLQTYECLTGGHNNLHKILTPMKARNLIQSGGLDTFMSMNSDRKDMFEMNKRLCKFINIFKSPLEI